MVRKVLGLFAVGALLCASVVMANEVKGKITKVDADKKTITVTMDGKEVHYTVADDCKMPPMRMRGKGGGGGGEPKAMTLKDLEAAVERAQERGGGINATITVEKKDGKEVVTEIKMERRTRGKQKDKVD